MNDTQTKPAKQVTFRASRSQTQSLAHDLAKNALSDISQKFIGRQHIVGTVGMMLYMFSLSQRAIGGWKEQDWVRTGVSTAALASPFTTLVSSRSGTYPEAGTFMERIKKSALHPDTYTMHASLVYGAVPAAVASLNDIHKGITGANDEAIRIVGGSLGLISQMMVWQSMFGQKNGVGRTGKLKNIGESENFLKFMLHDVEGLSARILPLATRIVGLTEGIVKTQNGRPSGKNFTLGSAVDLACYLIHVGYTYQQLWKAHRQASATEQSTTWTQEILDEKTSQLYSASIKKSLITK